MSTASNAFLQSLPRDPDEQLRLGLRVIEVAYEEKARGLDHEVQQLRAYSKERQNAVAVLERRVTELEQTVRDSDERARAQANEKAQLAQDLKAAQRDLSKLDSFKRSIMQSIKDEELPGGGFAVPVTPAVGGYGGDGALTGASTAVPAAYSPVPVRSSPPPMPPPASAAYDGSYGSPAREDELAAPGSAAPGSGAPPSPGADSSSAHMDGKDFFRQARLRLTYEQFNHFLNNIKRLNDHAQSRDETLSRAQDIFGAENADLFKSFKTLLTKHGLS